MLRWVAIVVGILLLLAGLFYYAMRPPGGVGFRLVSSYPTNSGYVVNATLTNGTKRPVRFLGSSSNILINLAIQDGAGVYQWQLTTNAASYSVKIDPRQELPLTIAVTTNRPAYLHASFQPNQPLKVALRNAVLWIMNRGRYSVNPSDSIGLIVQPPAP